MVSAVVGGGRELAVVGGGVIGLSCALAALDSGWSVTVFDAGPESRASWVAGGMLGSLGEGIPGENEALRISSASVRRWPAFLERLAGPGIVTATDSLFVADSATDLAGLHSVAEFVAGEPLLPEGVLIKLSRKEIRGLEPSLGARIMGGYRAPGEWAVDNRRLLGSLTSAVEAAGAVIVHAAVTALDDLRADQILLAAGLGSTQLWPGLGLYGLKGEVLRLRRAQSVPPPTHVIRGRVNGRSVYLVPREDGIVVGATQYEAQSPSAAQAGGVSDLLTDAFTLMPGLRTYELVQVSAGVRPCTRDGLPIIRRLDGRTVVAAGHGRNGIVLAPWTADQVMVLLSES